MFLHDVPLLIKQAHNMGATITKCVINGDMIPIIMQWLFSRIFSSLLFAIKLHLNLLIYIKSLMMPPIMSGWDLRNI